MLFEKIFDIKIGAPINRYKSIKKTNIRVPSFTVKSIENMNIIKENLDKIYLKKDLMPEFFSKEKDILLKVASPYNSALIDKNMEGVLIPSNFFLLRVKEEMKCKVLPEYVVYLLNSKAILNQIKRIEQGSAAVISLKKTDLKDITIDLPSFEDQKKYSKLYDLLKKRLDLLQKKMDLESKLFTEIIGKF